MYTLIERRTVNRERIGEAMTQAEHEFLPKLRTAPGFIGFYLVVDEPHNVNTAIVVWESKEQADAFDAVNSRWMGTLESLGHTLESDNRGETVLRIESTPAPA